MAEQIDIILFDIGKVVVDFDTAHIVREFARRSLTPPEDIARIISTSPVYHDFERGTISPAAFHVAIENHLSVVIPYPEFLLIWNDLFTQKTDMEAFVREMKRKCRIAALSNTNTLHWSYLQEKFDIISEFDDYFLSFQLRCRKPEKAIYQHALDYYKLPPEKIAYIDDVPSFVAVAQSMGIQGYVFTTLSDIRRRISIP